ncbi:leucine-rich repeat and IQ domain-containing protein 1-like isoform X2 [Nematostella vectensis]|uniref:leucine-rich repeat and IQ domain-containing protein 1-like isoform X2 n=1 Tax=Nematostella vectensis TaxID=45351 RepID=UPI002076DBF3|nr:leucine-rich repeat and IQ domain-containing protein 1-like isoform X2 [Nematostella vectensis]
MTKIAGDNDVDFEAEIQRELEAITEDDLEIVEIEELDESDIGSDITITKTYDLPDTLQEYLNAVHARLDGAEEGVRECDSVLELIPLDNKGDEERLARKIKEALGDEYEDPISLHNQVLSEINEEELNEEKQNADSMALAVISPDVNDTTMALEVAAQQQIKELEKKQAAKIQHREALYAEMRKKEEERMSRERKERERRQQEFIKEQKDVAVQQKAQQESLKETLQEQEKETIQQLEEDFKAQLNELEVEKAKEQTALEEMKREEAFNKETELRRASTMIQKVYRGHRVYSKYKDILEARNRQRKREREEELERIERVEEMQRKTQEKKRIEEEEQKRKEAEEKKAKEIEQRRMEEEIKKEEEKKRKEAEEKRVKEEQIRLEKERKRKEADDRQREEARKEEEEKRKREGEVKKRKEEEERLVEARRKEQEEKRKLEEQKRKEEEDRRRKEAEEKRIKEEEARLKEERRSKDEEENRRKADEERKRKEQEEAERNRVVQEEKRKIEQEGKQRKKESRKQEEQNKKEQILNKMAEVLDKSNCITKEDNNESDSKNGTISETSANLECLRQDWLKQHTPWSQQTFENRSQPVARGKPRSRRPFSASRNLPSLTEDQLLVSSPPGTPLHKVVYVHVTHAPACKIQAMKRCPALMSLVLIDCGLVAVEGLEECQSLEELNVENNKVEFVNCGALPRLEHICLKENNLTSVQGIEDCKSLRCIDASRNRITRLGDIASCSKLQKLSLDHNQLIATKGLSSLRVLQTLSCAHNHLPNVKEIEGCQLLENLDLRANNLLQPPSLTNHVLLRELRLDDNSICTLEPLAKSWLPLLETLSVSQNSISFIDALCGLPLLTKLDISHNLITDVEGLVPGLKECSYLEELSVDGNPVSEDPHLRNAISQDIPNLKIFDNEILTPSANKSVETPFIVMCKRQAKEQDDMKEKHKRETRNLSVEVKDSVEVIERLDLKRKHYREWHDLAVEHLIQHETFYSESPLQPASRPRPTATPLAPPTADTTRQTRERQEVAATKIQALFRGWSIRHRIEVQMQKWMAAVTIQAAWRGYHVRSRPRPQRISRARRALWDARHHAAATTIQAHYRGYRVRRRIAHALQTAQFTYVGDEEDDEFNYDEEVDLTAFDLDEGYLETGWTPTDMPQLPSRGPALPAANFTKGRTYGQNTESSDEWKPRHAWRSAGSPAMADTIGRSRHAGMSIPIDTMDQDLQSVTSGTQSHMTHRAEELSSEWGLKDVSTAELMWKRANRMKYNPARKRKLLDPTKRLALFKKLDDANKLREVRPPPKREPPKRMEYFAARDAGLLRTGSTTPINERRTKAQMTYSWVYNQGVIHQDEPEAMSLNDQSAEPRIKKSPVASRPGQAPVNLPHMDPVSLAGRNVPLVSNSSLVQESLSRSSTSRRRGGSLSSEEVRFPPIKTHSVPNLTARSEGPSEVSSRSPEKSNSAGARITKERKTRR